MLNILRRQAAKYLLSQQNKPAKLSALEFAFVDSKGQRYYNWPTLSEIPTIRHSKLMEMVAYSDAKISRESLITITEEIEKRNFALITEKVEKTKRQIHAQITVLLNEITDRSSFSVPKEIMIQMAAILICREDENVAEFSDPIHNQKVIQLKAEAEKGYTFFLTTPTLKELYPSLLGTTEQQTELLMNWEYQSRRQIARLKVISQDDESKSDKSPKEQ
jgi:hypothetical protein